MESIAWTCILQCITYNKNRTTYTIFDSFREFTAHGRQPILDTKKRTIRTVFVGDRQSESISQFMSIGGDELTNERSLSAHR